MPMQEMLRHANHHIVRCCSVFVTCVDTPAGGSQRRLHFLQYLMLRDPVDLQDQVSNSAVGLHVGDRARTAPLTFIEHWKP